jgi:hypothetical protein
LSPHIDPIYPPLHTFTLHFLWVDDRRDVAHVRQHIFILLYG